MATQFLLGEVLTPVQRAQLGHVVNLQEAADVSLFVNSASSCILLHLPFSLPFIVNTLNDNNIIFIDTAP